MSAIAKATWTLLLAAIGVSIAWQLMRPLIPALIVIVALWFVYQIALGWFRRDGW